MDFLFEVLANGINLTAEALFWAMDEAYDLGGGSLLPPLFTIIVPVVTGALLVLS